MPLSFRMRTESSSGWEARAQLESTHRTELRSLTSRYPPASYLFRRLERGRWQGVETIIGGDSQFKARNEPRDEPRLDASRRPELAC